MHVVTCSPSIDVMRLLLEEHGSTVQPHFIENKVPFLGALDVDQMLDKAASIRADFPSDGIVILLTSPENPTGEIWTLDALEAVAMAAIRLSGIVIADHAYLTAGVHAVDDVPAIWEVAPDACDWLGIWDTGKTFGLNEDKLGFLIWRSDRLGACAELALSTLQFGVARRQKLLFTRILAQARRAGYVDSLRELCRRNLETAISQVGDAPLAPRNVTGGSVLLLELSDMAYTDEEARVGLLAERVGVVAGRVFFHTAWKPSSLLRVALAGEPDYFGRAFSALGDFLVRRGTGLSR